MCGKDAVLKLRLSILKRDAGAQGRPELQVDLCEDNRDGAI